jgi:hypothetical protein
MTRKKRERLHIVAARYGSRTAFIHESDGYLVLLTEDQLRRVKAGKASIERLTGWDELRETIAPCYGLRMMIHFFEWVRVNHPRVYDRWNTGGGEYPIERIGEYPPEEEKPQRSRRRGECRSQRGKRPCRK